jgi:hypothetical protein
VERALFLQGNMKGLNPDNSLTSSTELKNQWSHTPPLLICHHGMQKERFAFTENNLCVKGGSRN